MAEFDPTQSSVQYGESLLASQQKERGKWKNRSRKIKTFKKVLGAIGVADLILTKRQQRKLDDFDNNWAAEKAQAINRINQASQFNNKELATLRGYDAGIDFSDPNDWKIEYDKLTNKVISQGPIYDAISQQQAAAIRKSKYGLGTTGDIPPADQEEYHALVKEASLRTLDGLRAKYAKHSPSLYKDKDLVTAEYKRMGQEAAKQILSARNTSSIRKILDKFGIADDIDPNLEQVKLGGVNLYFDKTLKQDYDDRKLAQDYAEAEYKDLLKRKDRNLISIEKNYIKTGSRASAAGFVTTYPDPFAKGDTYWYQVKGAKAQKEYGFAISSKNPRIGILDDLPFTYTLTDGVTPSTNAAHLSKLDTENPEVFATWAQVQDSLIAKGKISGSYKELDEIKMRFDLHLGEILDKKVETYKIKPKDVKASEEDIALAKLKAIQDLVTIGKRTGRGTFEVTVKDNAQFQLEVLNSSASSDDEKNKIKIIMEDGKTSGSKPTLETVEGVQVLSNPRTGIETPVSKILDRYKDQFEAGTIESNKKKIEKVRDDFKDVPNLLSQIEEIYSDSLDPKTRYTTEEIETGEFESLEEIRNKEKQLKPVKSKFRELFKDAKSEDQLEKLREKLTYKDYQETKRKSDLAHNVILEIEEKFGVDPNMFVMKGFIDKAPKFDIRSRYRIEREMQDFLETPSRTLSSDVITDINTFLDEYDYTQTVDVKKKVDKVRPVVTERTENISTLLTGHLKRFDIDNEEQAISNLLDVFVPAVLEIESSGDYKAKNKISTARGGFQFLQGSVEPALNRVEKYLGEQPWGAQLRIHKDASLLTSKQQTLLFIGDMLEKKGSDKLMQLVFNGDMEGMIKAYEVLHHTAPDKATAKRAEKIFNTYF